MTTEDIDRLRAELERVRVTPVVHEPAAPPALSRCSRCGFACPDNDDKLAAEVRMLRAQVTVLLAARDGVRLEFEVLVASIARVETLPAEWRKYAAGLPHNRDNTVIGRVRLGCAEELEAALRGTP